EVIGKKDPQLIIAVIRGDMDVSEDKVRNQIGALSLRAANEEEIKRVGCFPGFASPINIKRENVIVIADDLIPRINNLVAGANDEDYHLIHTCYGRDYEADIIADIVEYKPDSPFANIDSLRGNSLASLVNDHVYYSELFQASFMGTQGRPELIHLSYGRIDLHSVMLAVVSQSSDEMGLNWPEAISPYQVSLVSLADGEETVEEAEKIYQELQSRGVRVLYDDRHKKVAGPGVKFKDSDLQGIPVRITVSKRALSEGGVEVKKRNESVKEVIAIKDIYSIIT
ncbi:MAG: proline--tRNA ligase, partial [Bacteroidetes bacterium]|nr:proline--tRNA ligase [Bacteroidota bacterium]